MTALIDSFRNFANAPKNYTRLCFCRVAQIICALLPYYPAYSGNFLPTLQDDPSVPSSRVKKTSWPLKIVPICFPETSVRNYHCTLGNMPEDRRSHLLTTKYGPKEKKIRDENVWRNVVLGEGKSLHSWQSLDGWMNLLDFKLFWLLGAFLWVIPRRLNSDAGELPRRKHTIWMNLMFMGPCIIFIVE